MTEIEILISNIINNPVSLIEILINSIKYNPAAWVIFFAILIASVFYFHIWMFNKKKRLHRSHILFTICRNRINTTFPYLNIIRI